MRRSRALRIFSDRPKLARKVAVLNPATMPSRGGKARAAKVKQIRLLIADDHALILEGLSAMIARQEDMAVVAKASNGRDAVELWQKHRPDVSLLDLRMPR